MTQFWRGGGERGYWFQLSLVNCMRRGKETGANNTHTQKVKQKK